MKHDLAKIRVGSLSTLGLLIVKLWIFISFRIITDLINQLMLINGDFCLLLILCLHFDTLPLTLRRIQLYVVFLCPR